MSILLTYAAAWGRDGGHTFAAGSEILWMFGDTFTPRGLLSATAAWSRRDAPLRLREATDASGTPFAFLPLTPEEVRFNADHAEPPECCLRRASCPRDAPYCVCPPGTDCRVRIALWPGDGVAAGPDGITVMYESFFIGAAPYDFRRIGVGVAGVPHGSTVARRRRADGRPVYVFGPSEPGFARGTTLEVSPWRGFFYAFADGRRNGCSVDALLARVPAAEVDRRSAYRFWNGHGWSARLADARPVVTGAPAGLGSVAWHEGLGAFVSVSMDHCTAGTVLVRLAPRPEGPWSRAFAVDLRPLGARGDAYYGWQHPELSGRRSIVVSYYQPFALVEGQIRLVRLVLADGGGRRPGRRGRGRP